MTIAPIKRLSKYCLNTLSEISSSISIQLLSISFVKYLSFFISPLSHIWAGMSNNTYCFKLIYMIVYISMNGENIILVHNVYYTESEQFMAHAQERIPRKGGTTCSPRKGGERRLPTTLQRASCMPSMYKYSKN